MTNCVVRASPVDRQYPYFGFLFLSIVACTNIAGCIKGSADSKPSPTTQDQFADIEKSPADSRTLNYRFGVIRPNQRVSHTFLVSNDSSHTWSLKSIITQCRCTVGGLTPTEIAPGQTAQFTVGLVATAAEVNLAKRLNLRFNEPDSPSFWFALEAVVRNAMSVSPNRLILRGESGSTVDGYFTVSNYSDTAWSDLDLKYSESWISCDAHEIPTNVQLVDAPRQIWRVAVHCAKLSKLSAFSDATVTVTSKGDQGNRNSVKVGLSTIPKMHMHPTSVFFGHIMPSRSRTEKVYFEFLKDVAAPQLREIKITNSKPELVSTSWLRDDKNLLTLVVTCRNNSSPCLVKDEIEIELPQSYDCGKISIPVTAMCD
jgi:Protein of unknown function (DUF1573)